jgi:Tol biopolymer transport system component
MRSWLGTDRGPGVSADIARYVPQALAAIALLIVAAVSLSLIGGRIPFVGGGGGGGATNTATPSNVVVVDPRSKVPGSILYTKAGNIWLQTGDKATQLTTGGSDSMPAWAPDGSHVYFIRTTISRGDWPADGAIHKYYLQTPSLMRVEPRSGAEPEELFSGVVKRGDLTWHVILREPAISPDGKTAAVVTDAPDPTKSDVVLKLIDLASSGLTDARAAENPPLGHQDPVWSPDGTYVYVVKDARNGSRGAPVIARYEVATKKTTTLTAPGYLAPSVSPDGRYLAVTRTDSFGTDVAVLDARTGTELLRVTRNGHSFSPVWSPAGDSIAYFEIDGAVVDLKLVRISGSAPAWQLGEPLALTISAGLDPGSRPAWYIPPEELPKPTPTTNVEPSVAPSTAPSP